MKTCNGCGDAKPVDYFYVSAGSPDGHVSKCKECTKAGVRQNRLDNHDHYIEYDRNRNMLPQRVAARAILQKTPAGKFQHKLALVKHQRLHPDRYRARYAVTNAIRDGRLMRMPCEVCGNAKTDGHHPDYSRPLDVKWLCRKHHTDAHRSAA